MAIIELGHHLIHLLLQFINLEVLFDIIRQRPTAPLAGGPKFHEFSILGHGSLQHLYLKVVMLDGAIEVTRPPYDTRRLNRQPDSQGYQEFRV